MSSASPNDNTALKPDTMDKTAQPTLPPPPLPTLVIPPASGREHTHTVVFLHGRGSTTTSFVAGLRHDTRDSRGRSLLDALPPTFRWVFPQAPLRRCATRPDVWHQWFDVADPRDFRADERGLQAQGIAEMVQPLRDIVAAEAARLGGRWDRVVLAGFSQGAAMAAHAFVGLEIPRRHGAESSISGRRRLCAVMCFAGRFPCTNLHHRRWPAREDDREVLLNTPVLVQHAEDDPMVPVDLGRELCDVLRRAGAETTWNCYKFGGHWLNSPEGVDDTLRFLEGAMQIVDVSLGQEEL